MFCFAMESPEKALDAGKHERTAIARPAEAQPVFGLHASFEAAWRPVHGRPKAFDCAPQIGLAHARSPTTLTSALAHALKEKGFRAARFAKARAARAGNLQKSGRFRGKLTEPVNALHALEAEGQRSAKRRSSVAPVLSSLKLRSVCKAGRFCRSRQNDGWQRLALRRQPPCGGRRYGCRASWPCRRDCR